jgi:hypothetical protein
LDVAEIEYEWMRLALGNLPSFPTPSNNTLHLHLPRTSLIIFAAKKPPTTNADRTPLAELLALVNPPSRAVKASKIYQNGLEHPTANKCAKADHAFRSQSWLAVSSTPTGAAYVRLEG